MRTVVSMTWRPHRRSRHRSTDAGLSPVNKVDKLRGLRELTGVPDGELQRVAGAGDLAVIPAGTLLAGEEGPARWCYLVLSGTIGPAPDDGGPSYRRAVTDLVVFAVDDLRFAALLDSCPAFARAVQAAPTEQAAEAGPPSVLPLVRGA
jgi:hypothetical protein